ncbi:hypothetical protein F511_15186 [Dorcoceras hygrometricum]|uniref:Uncharacterized protein n=1 Tax=Dorcoceras hygrometricum TaxID=472368 RepID=A0A2Z7CN22_9LAMI|nr:hypothetical protein F511_15186 [Dorcoceras hygrometricum]
MASGTLPHSGACGASGLLSRALLFHPKSAGTFDGAHQHIQVLETRGFFRNPTAPPLSSDSRRSRTLHVPAGKCI